MSTTRPETSASREIPIILARELASAKKSFGHPPQDNLSDVEYLALSVSQKRGLIDSLLIELQAVKTKLRAEIAKRRKP